MEEEASWPELVEPEKDAGWHKVVREEDAPFLHLVATSRGRGQPYLFHDVAGASPSPGLLRRNKRAHNVYITQKEMILEEEEYEEE